jgi:hypothetical protein
VHHHKDAFLHSTKKDKPDYQMFACQDSENTSNAFVNDPPHKYKKSHENGNYRHKSNKIIN